MITHWMAGEEIALAGMLQLRERRAALQEQLLRSARCLVCFSLNIAGPVKRTALTDLLFEAGCLRIQAVLSGLSLQWRQVRMEDPAGLTACYSCDGAPETVKKYMIELEEAGPEARLWDIDVLRGAGQKVSRTELDAPPRRCFLCEKPAVYCARSRAHSLEQLQAYTQKVLWDWYVRTQAERIGGLAQRALLHEVAVTPKPGLVDRRNNGAHSDMDFFSFLDSACVLRPYFTRCAQWGLEHAGQLPEAGLTQLQAAGMLAEQQMYQVTGGANTHKGAVFSLGILCAAAGILAGLGEAAGAERLGELAAQMVKGSPPGRGARASAAGGYRAEVALLRRLQKAAAGDVPWERALTELLLQVMCETEDTNLQKRGGNQGLAYAQAYARRLLAEGQVSAQALEEMDQAFIERNLSPGGCADLLAVICFFYFWEKGEGAGA